MEKRKDAAAVRLGRKGGKARWAGTTAKQRSDAARQLSIERWRQAREALAEKTA